MWFTEGWFLPNQEGSMQSIQRDSSDLTAPMTMQRQQVTHNADHNVSQTTIIHMKGWMDGWDSLMVKHRTRVP